MKGMIAAAAWLVALAPSTLAAQTQAQMNSTAAAGWRAADAAMTREWRATYAYMKRLDARNTSRGGGFGYVPATLASQRAWLVFRDAQCVIEGGEFAGGSMQPLARTRCLERLTRERTRQLQDLRWKR